MEDVATDKPLQGANEFIRSLHHRSWIVQIEQLKDHRRTDLEKLLSIFDQENRTKNHHILHVDEAGFPEEYRSIIRRLRMAAESEEIQMEMEMEDDYVEELRDKERKIAEKEKIIKEKVKVIEEKEKALQEQGKAFEKQVKVIEEKDKALDEKDKAFEEQGKALEEKDRLIEELRKQLSGRRE
ncbi:MAG: hypothetical protein LBL07_06715 [Tannerella sp.]|nr:hypothetical protein [Tannerella sp.]